MTVLSIAIAMAVLGVILILQVRREALRARGSQGGLERLKRRRYQVLISLLSLAPGFWLLSALNAGDIAEYVLIGLAVLLAFVYFAISAAIGWLSAFE